MRDNAKGGALTEVTFYILLSLYTPKHGYAVMQFIEEKTDGRLSLGAGTLYGALNSLQDKKWIEPYGDSEGRKKEYHITAQGKEIAEKELARLNELVSIASEIIGDEQTAFLPLQHGHQPGGSPVRGWHHRCHRLHCHRG